MSDAAFEPVRRQATANSPRAGLVFKGSGATSRTMARTRIAVISSEASPEASGDKAAPKGGDGKSDGKTGDAKAGEAKGGDSKAVVTRRQ